MLRKASALKLSLPFCVTTSNDGKSAQTIAMADVFDSEDFFAAKE